MSTRSEMLKSRGVAKRKNPRLAKPKARKKPDRPLDRRAHAGRRGGAALEETATDRPSRKSTRKSSDRTKRTTNLQLREQMRTHSPPARAARAKVGGTL
jgi:hypothetical protein